ncbi:MAG: hypothetical protein HQ491_04290 [Bacteroidetes bacterium]|jgi:hypothetical protein|uniref:hypothetical protein n=1 Tax=Daejeonella sp. TaxID=2805397 RepID=UPI0040493E66|nr:hypothetical protein [Bacteroidota bacterium]
MKSPKKTSKSEGSGKKAAKGPVKKQTNLTDPNDSPRPVLDDEDDFDIQLDDDIEDFHNFDEDEDDF